MKQKWLLGTLPNTGHIDTTHTVTQIYSNLVENGTWKKELTDTDHIVSLTTLVSQMKASIARNTIYFTTQTGKPPVDSANPRTGNRNNRKTPYTVAAWRIDKKGESQTKYGIEWQWCTKDQYSGGVVHNGMYARHKKYEHDAWRKEFYEKKANGKTSKANLSATTSPAPNADAKKLALIESLRAAMCTQAGLSSEVADRLYSDACRELGNE